MKIHSLMITGVLVLVCALTGAGPVSAGGDLENMGNGICRDKVTGLMWQIGKSRRFSDIEDVQNYIAGLKLGGYTDWRLPTTRESSELRGLIAIQGNDDCQFPKLKSKYWLKDPKKGTIPARLELECFCRGDYDLVPKDKGYVRVVRDGKKDGQ